MTLGQRIVLIITACIFLLGGFGWLFSDASLAHPIGGLLLFFIVIGVPALLFYKAVGRK